MITRDIELVKDIFALIDAGIVHGYDAFRYDVVVGDGYTDEELVVERDGIEVTNAETDFDGAVLYDLLKQLKENSVRRGECWTSFVMSYRKGEQVKTNFKRE